MTAPNRNTLWAEVFVDELAAAGVGAVCIAPGSRSTPLTVAFANRDDVRVFSHLDERSAAFFALGRGRLTGRPTPVVCTSGTAAANLHPAVLEASESRVPLVLLTADRPPELWESGANQTTNQERLYGGAVRWYRTLPEPEPEDRKLRSLRVTAGRAVAEATGCPAGPVHLNVPFRKPLEPVPVEDDIPPEFEADASLAVGGRDGPFVSRARGRPELSGSGIERVQEAVAGTDRGLVICGPANRPTPSRDALAALAEATGFPVFADPLSGHRFGHEDVPVCGGYDSYLAAPEAVPTPELVVRFGASPTSKELRKFLSESVPRQFLVDPAGGWREAEFAATDLVEADPTAFAERLVAGLSPGPTVYRDRMLEVERQYWDHVETACAAEFFEGAVLRAVVDGCPDPATVFVSNSMPVRDLDRFGRPAAADLTVLGNRGVSGIDGVTSTALGAGSATDDPLVAVVGDLAFYHDMNGLLAVERCGVDATIVLVDNDGGGIFHKLPIEGFDPPFTEQFRTPHGLDLSRVGELYDISFVDVSETDALTDSVASSTRRDGTQVLHVETDAESSHRFRETLHEEVCASLARE
ncbi:MAG: 2-succinyl-5-enolpyruvyl-6-hydroxy-3-cyclohexene-1-carboxylic-acid synthase [Halovenus sp.]